jgi:type I restriction enzyme, S subunit
MEAAIDPIGFGDLLTEPVRNGLYKAKEFHGRGIKIVNMGELFAYPRLKDVPMKRIEVTESERKRFLLRAGDLLFARRSLVAEGAGKCSIVLEVNEHTTFESSIIRARPDVGKANSVFLYYFFNSPRGLQLLGTIRRQVAVSGITGKDLSDLKLILPPLHRQHAVANTLSALDEMIELNRKTNETLEAMARAIFKSWFIDFDPVRAKAEGRQPIGMDAATAALFSDSFEDSELGEIPRGWKVERLGRIADVNWGDTNVTKASYSTSGFTAYSAKGPDGFMLYHDYDRIGVVVSAIGANSGATWLAVGKWSCIKNTLRFWATDDAVSTEYLYAATFGNDKWPMRGSAQPFIAQGDARAMRVLVPSNKLASLFGDIVRPFYIQQSQLTSESQTLIQLRDTLLPKLMSGEIAVGIDHRSGSAIR